MNCMVSVALQYLELIKFLDFRIFFLNLGKLVKIVNLRFQILLLFFQLLRLIPQCLHIVKHGEILIFVFNKFGHNLFHVCAIHIAF